MSDALYDDAGVTTTLTESERNYISIALANLITVAEDVPELPLDELLDLHAKFLMPSDIAA